MDASYRVYSLVRSVRRRGDQPRIGVMFFGKQPPRGFSGAPGRALPAPVRLARQCSAPKGLREGHTLYRDAGHLAVPAGGQPVARDPGRRIGRRGAPVPNPDESGPGRYTPPAMTAPSTIPKGRAGMPVLPERRGARSRVPPDRTDDAGLERAPLQRAHGSLRELHDPAGGRVGRRAAGGADRRRQRQPRRSRVMTTLSFQKGDVVLLRRRAAASRRAPRCAASPRPSPRSSGCTCSSSTARRRTGC